MRGQARQLFPKKRVAHERRHGVHQVPPRGPVQKGADHPVQGVHPEMLFQERVADQLGLDEFPVAPAEPLRAMDERRVIMGMPPVSRKRRQDIPPE